MDLLQPIFLWGLIGAGVPLLIHLWNKRQGVLLDWAASRWLPTPNNQPVKGLRLDNWLLLLLRMLLIILVVLLLSQPHLSSMARNDTGRTIHLVQPAPGLVENYKFELSNAINNGEDLFWLNENLERITDLNDVAELTLSSRPLQQALHQKVTSADSLHIYVLNSSNSLDLPYYTPVEPVLHLHHYASRDIPQFIQTSDTTALTLSDYGQLVKRDRPDYRGRQVLWQGQPIPVWIELSEEDSVHIGAALGAITEVYSIGFPRAENRQNAMIFFHQQLPPAIDPNKLYFTIDSLFYPGHSNVVCFPDAVPEQLPEMILAALLDHIGLDRMEVAQTQSQLESHFIKVNELPAPREGNVFEFFWILLLLTLVAERYLSIRKGL